MYRNLDDVSIYSMNGIKIFGLTSKAPNFKFYTVSDPLRHIIGSAIRGLPSPDVRTLKSRTSKRNLRGLVVS